MYIKLNQQPKWTSVKVNDQYNMANWMAFLFDGVIEQKLKIKDKY